MEPNYIRGSRTTKALFNNNEPTRLARLEKDGNEARYWYMAQKADGTCHPFDVRKLGLNEQEIALAFDIAIEHRGWHKALTIVSEYIGGVEPNRVFGQHIKPEMN